MAQQKIKGAPLATGYWGRNPSSHIAAVEIPQKVLALHRDKILAMGLPFNLWQRLQTASEVRSVQCTCWRDTTQQGDVQCLQCHGMRWQPGFLRFGYRTTFYSAAHTDLTFTSIAQITANTPYRLALTGTNLTGQIVTPTFTVPSTNYGTWSYHLDAPIRATGNTVVAEFTVNGGTTWQDITNLPTVNPQLGAVIQFRFTLTRVAAADKSPLFEIFRARYPAVPPIRSGDVNPGEILLIKTWDVDKFMREQMGKSTQSQGEKYWTLPLNYFDTTLTPESMSTVLGPDHFLEEARGPEVGVRYVSTQHSYSRTFKMFTRQEFLMRRVVGEAGDPKLGESLMKVW
jgi:hypothetical protein